MKNRSVVLGALVLIGLVMAVLWWTKPFASRAVSPDVAKAPAIPPLPSDATPKTPRVAHATPEQFEQALGLPPITVIEINDELIGLQRDLAERRGAQARVLDCDGVTLRLFVPGLVLSDEELAKIIKERLSGIVSQEKAGEICGHPVGRRYLELRLSLERLGADAWYTFTKLRDEDLSRHGLDVLASFNTTIRHVSATGAPPFGGSENEKYLGQTLDSIASSYYIGWNAASKAPLGYFQKAPILGVASRPKERVHGTINYDTGKVTIRNLRFEGSKDEADLNEASEKGKR